MLSNFTTYLAYTRKAIINVLGLATSLLALGLLPDKYSAVVAGAVAFLTAVLHFITPNAPAPGGAPAVEDFDTGEEVPDDWQPAPVVTAGQVAAQHEPAVPPSPSPSPAKPTQ